MGAKLNKEELIDTLTINEKIVYGSLVNEYNFTGITPSESQRLTIPINKLPIKTVSLKDLTKVLMVFSKIHGLLYNLKQDEVIFTKSNVKKDNGTLELVTVDTIEKTILELTYHIHDDKKEKSNSIELSITVPAMGTKISDYSHRTDDITYQFYTDTIESANEIKEDFIKELNAHYGNAQFKIKDL